MPMVPEQVNILGVRVSAVNPVSALETIEAWLGERESHYVCVTSVNGIMESQRSPALRDIHNAAGLVVPDGMPLVWLCRLRGFGQVRRVYGPALTLALCERSQEKGYTHFFYGSAAGVADQLIASLKDRFPALRVVGSCSPPYREQGYEEDPVGADLIREARPDVVWVGLPTPKQELWMASNVARLGVPVLIGVGAAFDFLSGRKQQAPTWMQRTGLEWLFRLLAEPRRLWKRYLVGNPLFVLRVLAQALGLKKYD